MSSALIRLLTTWLSVPLALSKQIKAATFSLGTLLAVN